MIKYILINIVSTILRLFPLPQKTGLIKIGNPKRNSPVLLTCNYRLTTERLKRRLAQSGKNYEKRFLNINKILDAFASRI